MQRDLAKPIHIAVGKGYIEEAMKRYRAAIGLQTRLQGDGWGRSDEFPTRGGEDDRRVLE